MGTFLPVVVETWVPGAAGSPYDVDHLPYAECDSEDGYDWYIGTRIGDFVLDLSAVIEHPLVESARMHPLLAAGPRFWAALRARLVELLTDPAHRAQVEPHLRPVHEVGLELPFSVADYVDFFASEHHATNVGRIFRPGGEPLAPNWKHLPVGYHGRAGTVMVSGTPVQRPVGQRGPGDVGPTRRLDLEAELGFVVGAGSDRPVRHDAFEDHVFGVVGLNDWSARDLQAWETRPLGPLLGKSFATSISAWVTPLAALAAAWVDLPAQDPEPVDYLGPGRTRGLDVAVEVEVNGTVLSRPSYAEMYWSPAQMLAHLTVNGSSVRTGDLLGSGTISGPRADQRGCLLELTEGEGPWLEDGDEVVLRYSAPSVLGNRLSLGEVRGTVRPTPEA